MEPKKPAAGEMPFAVWNFARAALVALPKVVVSLPGEPVPTEATAKPCVLRKDCRAFTSSPIEPTCKSRVKELDATAGIDTCGGGTAVV